MQVIIRRICSILLLLNPIIINAQTTTVDSGSYTNSFPGADAAGRNTFPSGTPFTIGKAKLKSIPTNDWWSAKVKNKHADNLFNYPFTMKTVNSGLVVTYIPWGVIDNIQPIVVGVNGLNADTANVSDFSDWTISMDWQNAGHHFEATTGVGMPFIYFKKDSSDVAKITVNQGTVSIQNEMLVISNARNGADFAVYGPSGSVWQNNGNNYTSTLNGKNYWSLAFIPLTASNVNTTATNYKKHAYVFPINTTVDWSYSDSTAELISNFNVSTEILEGTDSTVLMGLLPHQWSNLNVGSPKPNGDIYRTVRGDLKMLDGNHFSVRKRFYGILPTLPYLDYYSKSFSPGELDNKIQSIYKDQLSTWTDSYNEGQMMNRLIQTARIAELTGDTVAVQKIVKTIKERLEDWLKAESGEVAFLFYYNKNWDALIGYPAGHGQDANINDHHFHWGYFIHAASFLEQHLPGWANQWGEMVNHLVRDAASTNRSDSLFPFLRNFNPYSGHCWANGFATFPQGNDQESTSESMQFNSALIHWGTITNNKEIRDLGIYLYTTEQSAIEEYWFDASDRNFGTSQQYSLVSRVWGNSYDNGTFWTNDIAASYGIEMYPIHGGSLYLGQDTTYSSKLWNEITSNTGILNNQQNPNLWHDVYWEYLAFHNPEKAIQLYDSYPNRDLKFGISDAQTYHWLHAMNALGIVDTTIYANYPIAAAFVKDTLKTYVAYNYDTSKITVEFSDGYQLEVAGRTMATSRDSYLKGVLSAPFNSAYPGDNINLRLETVFGVPETVEFIWEDSLLGMDSIAPFEFNAKGLPAGKHKFYARLYDSLNYTISNVLQILSGEQLPFNGNPFKVPGTIEPGNYDIFDGGNASSIAYQDQDIKNQGNYRTNEYVDASLDANEGPIVGWISGEEWLEYTIKVDSTGLYRMNYRYASGNTNGGGPFHLIMDQDTIKTIQSVPSTSAWDIWASRNANNIPLKKGENILRIAFEGGEFNLGRMTFTFTSNLPYSQPIADAGINQLIQLPTDTIVLDASQSSDPNGSALHYQWKQIYGPTVLQFSNDTLEKPVISGLKSGVYLIQLEVDNGSYRDIDEVFVISSSNNNIHPKVSIYNPIKQQIFLEFDTVKIEASANDLNGQIIAVDFYVDSTYVGTDSNSNYENYWVPTRAGKYLLSARAMDNDSATNLSHPIEIIVEAAPPCRDSSSNREFLYEFSPAKNNPTLTFIPTLSGMGSPTCILYYGTSPTGPLPGYFVSPNVPFQLNASQGTTIYFYYTYSYPGQGQHNNSANMDTYKIGSCSIITSLDKLTKEADIRYYPNPVRKTLFIENTSTYKQLILYNYNGQEIDNRKISQSNINYDFESLNSGIYLIQLIADKKVENFKVIKR